jgi:hypothetical protein
MIIALFIITLLARLDAKLAFYNNTARPFRCEGWHFIITLLARLDARIGILLICGKHLHDRIIPLREEAWAHKISFTPPLFIEVPVPSH